VWTVYAGARYAYAIFAVHQYGLFKFRTGTQSTPVTPTMASRSRAAIFGLDAISRNLFHARAGSTKDSSIFGGSINTHRRAKSMASRSSVYSQSTITGDSSVSRSSARSRSTMLTAATSVEEDRMSYADSADTGSAGSRRSLSKTKKLIKKRHISPAGSGSEFEASPRRGSISRSTSSDWYTDNEDQDIPEVPRDQSEKELFERLELARQNSQSQNDAHYAESGEAGIHYGSAFVLHIGMILIY
jgi:protein ECT2